MNRLICSPVVCSETSAVPLERLSSFPSYVDSQPTAILKSGLMCALLLALIFLPRATNAQPNLVLDSAPVTWNIIGLDSNNVTVGPQDFPVGIRVLNTGVSDATNVTAQFQFTSANSFISLLDEDMVTTTVIPAGGFADFYFTVRVTRDSGAYDTMRNYSITISGGGLMSPLVATDTLYVQKLISQQANDVLSLVGPPVIQAGETRTFILTCETQTNRNQLETFVNFPNDLFQIVSIENSFSNPSPTTIDRFYVDACGWVRDNLPPDNNSCDGPDQFGGTVGGDVVTIYTVLVLQTPTETINLSALILDNSGNAYHYNSDFGDNILPVNPPADLFVVKTAIDNPVEAGDTVEYLITIVNPATNVVAKDVVLQDTLPAGLTFVSANPLPLSGPNPQVWNIGDMAASSTLSFTVIAQTNCTNTGMLTNTAVVSSTTTDTNTANNTSSQTIVVQDTTPPAIQCPAPLVVAADAGLCSKSNVTYSVTATDTCVTVTVVTVPPSGSTFPVGTTPVTATATDAAGNQATCTFNVTVTDSQPPLITCPPTIDLAADALSCSRANVSLTSPTATDNCTTVTVTGTRSDGMPLSAPYPVGTTIITWKATDAFGLMATCNQQVIIRDTTNPVIQCPSNITANADPGQCSKSNVTYSVTATDNCTTVTIVSVPASGSTFPVGTTTVNATATDAAGNQATCSFTVTVIDNQPPTITCPPTVNVNAGPNGCVAPNVNIMMPTVADNCANPVVTGTRDDGLLFTDPYPVGTTIITWKVTDASNNMATCQQQIIVADVTPPTIVCPPTVNVAASAENCLAANVTIGTPTTNDNCSTQTVVGIRSDMQPLNAPYPLGTTTITWTVTDTSGNTASCMQMVIVSDMTAPMINCPTVVNVSNAPGQCGANVNYTVTTSDTCGNAGITLVCTPPPGSFFPVGTTLVTCTATDLAGNQATCSFNVVVADTENPVLICPPDIATCMQDVLLGTPITSDNCATQSLTITRGDNLPLNADYPVGTTLVTYVLTDTAGNMASCIQTVMVADGVLPQIICPADLTIPALAGQCVSGPVQYPEPTVLDNCSTDTTNLTITFNPPEDSIFPLGETVVTATVTDPMQNSASCTFIVRVVDVTPPPLVCPANIVVSNTPGLCGSSAVNFTIPVTDPCSNPVTVVAVPPSGSIFPVGTIPVNVTATDAAGNVAMCSFTVTVNDTQPPTIVCPPPVNIMADVDQCQAANVDLGFPITSDNCSTASVMGSRSDMLALSAPYPVGITTVTWTVTDSAGNMASCTQTVTIRDTMMPDITCPPDITVQALAGQCVSGPVEYGAPIVSDNCSTDPANLMVTFNPPSGSTFPVGVSTVTATVTDAGGNQASCTFTVTVTDVTPPQVNCPANIVVSSAPGQCSSGPVTFIVSATDTCGLESLVVNPPPGSIFPVGITTVVATATDLAGNTATCSFTVTVNDTQPPQITCPDPIVVSTSPGVCEAQNVTYSALATDNCEGPVTVTFNPPSGSTLPLGVTTVQATATDGAGNTATCSFTVTVEDNDAPRIQCADDISVRAIACEPDATVPIVPPEAIDPCGIESVIGVRSDGRPLTDRFPIETTTTITWTATDANGNQSNCIQQVFVGAGDCQPVCDGPDLVVMTKMPPVFKCSKAPTCKVSGWYIITNIGTQTSNETSMCFYLSDDEVLDPSDFQFKPNKKKHRVKSLQPGEMVGVDLKGKAPKGINVEGKFILGFVDCPGVVTECREDNNTTSANPVPKSKK